MNSSLKVELQVQLFNKDKDHEDSNFQDQVKLQRSQKSNSDSALKTEALTLQTVKQCNQYQSLSYLFLSSLQTPVWTGHFLFSILLCEEDLHEHMAEKLRLRDAVPLNRHTHLGIICVPWHNLGCVWTAIESATKIFEVVKLLDRVDCMMYKCS